jgi:hypothetical protein
VIKDIFVFILACIIGTSCSNKTKRVNTNFNETHANKDQYSVNSYVID